MSSNTENPCDPKRSIEQHTGMLPRPAPEAAATSDTSQFNMDTNNPATSDILEGVIVEEILKAQMSQPVSVVVSFPYSTEKKRAERSSFATDKPGSPPLKEGGGAARRPRRVPVALEPTDETSHVGHTGRGSALLDESASQELSESTLPIVVQSVAPSLDYVLQTARRRESRLPVLPVDRVNVQTDSLFTLVSGPVLEATTDSFRTHGATDHSLLPARSSAGGVLLTLLHCVSQAVVNMIIKQLGYIPKTKLAFYAAFGLMTGHMPEGFALAKPLAQKQVQAQLVLRSIASLVSLLLKAEALRYITVSDMAIMFTIVPIGAMTFSWYFFSERMRVTQAVGIGLCAAGIVIVIRPTSLFGGPGATRHPDRFKGFLYALCSALSLVLLAVILRIMGESSADSVGFNTGLIHTTLAMFLTVISGSFGEIFSRRFLGTLMIVGKIKFCTVFFLGRALQCESVATVSTVKCFGDVTLSILVQMIFMGDYPDWWYAFGATVVLVSFAFITGSDLARWYTHNFIHQCRRSLTWVHSLSIYARPLVSRRYKLHFARSS